MFFAVICLLDIIMYKYISLNTTVDTLILASQSGSETSLRLNAYMI